MVFERERSGDKSATQMPNSSGFARRPLDRNSQHGAPLPGIHRYGTALIAAGNKDKAKTFVRMNRERHRE